MTILSVIILILSWIFKFFKIILWILGALLFALWWHQGKILYLPSTQGRVGEKRKLNFNSEGCRSPSEKNLPYEDEMICTRDGIQIHVWLIQQENKKNVSNNNILTRKCWEYWNSLDECQTFIS